MSVNVPNTRFFALIPCAGNGSRAGTSGPKQYEPIAGKPMVMHTLAAFAAVKRIAKTLVVVAQGDGFFTRNFAPVTAAACGGETRAISVANGLHELRKLGADSRDWVLVHDAARCLITPEQIDRLIDTCMVDDVGGLLAHKLADTLKTEKGGRVDETLSREGKWLAQTPQMFRIGRLIEALEQAGDEVTDEASAIEAVGQRPLLVPGSSQNFKVTYPDDFALAEAVLKGRQR
ncbi:MAG: 2-C-methyl-D-erythritol 4-phosphate cytidylyltransferase [Ramlibacter sp.]|jgi:2-C-methyl-D-erythritol 4-phosphate cytidylyltransferase|nr:2-C-methyl-D-erythritol 4-phosphate cytidylyltransferase [Ramlibacter sp.]